MFDRNKFYGMHKHILVFHRSIRNLERSKPLPYAEYEDKTMMYAEALLIEYQKGAVLCDAL
jgi:hypothetical protein